MPSRSREAGRVIEEVAAVKLQTKREAVGVPPDEEVGSVVGEISRDPVVGTTRVVGKTELRLAVPEEICHLKIAAAFSHGLACRMGYGGGSAFGSGSLPPMLQTQQALADLA